MSLFGLKAPELKEKILKLLHIDVGRGAAVLCSHRAVPAINLS